MSSIAAARRYGAQSMTGRLRRVLVNPPGPAYGAGYETEGVHYLAPIELDRAKDEHARLVAVLQGAGVEVDVLGSEAGADSVYTFDPTLVVDGGVILLRPGKPVRAGEPAAQEAWFEANDIPVAGRVEAPGTCDGGDLCWLDEDTLVIGRTLRTNTVGAEQVAALVRPYAEHVRIVDMPYHAGPSYCLHLLSAISPVDRDLAVVYRPLLPAGLWELLQERGIQTVDVPEEEFDSFGPNVLAIAPREAVIFEGNPRTAEGLRQAGATVHEVPGGDIGIKGGGGPTCLTRPVLRERAPSGG
jgi:N-dimethylarginine dimethylaminohydrolase